MLKKAQKNHVGNEREGNEKRWMESCVEECKTSTIIATRNTTKTVGKSAYYKLSRATIAFLLIIIALASIVQDRSAGSKSF